MNIGDLRFRTKLGVGFGVIFVLFSIIMVVSYQSLDRLGRATDMNMRSVRVLNQAENIVTALLSKESGVRGFVITGNEAFLEPYVAGRRDYQIALAEIKRLTANYPEHQERLAVLERDAEQWIANTAESQIAMRRQVNEGSMMFESLASVVARATGKHLMDEMRSLLVDIVADENARLDSRTSEVQRQEKLAESIIAYGGGATVGLGLLVAFAIGISIVRPMAKTLEFSQRVQDGDYDATLDIRQKDEIGKLADGLRAMVDSLKEKIREADRKSREAAAEAERAAAAMREAEEASQRAEEGRAAILEAAARLEEVVEIVTSSSEQLSAQVEQSSRGAEMQKDRAGETATAMEEMNATVLEVAKSAAQAAESADQAREQAQSGSEVVTQVVSAIGQVEEQAARLKGNMSGLGKQAEGIGQIMNVISDIADQTNLLALNAAIEAARAGDAGRGFAVVADEVRKLAEKTMAATKEVGEAINGIQQGTRQSISSVEQAADAIEQATALARTSGEALVEIVSLVETSADQVRAIATASEEQSSASEEINRAVEDINRISIETSDAMGQSAQAVSDLARQASELRKLIREMKQA